MKFIHCADCHVGGWRDPKMRALSIKSFEKFTEDVLLQKPDFLLISGDLFNTSHPPIDALKAVVLGLKKLSDADISVYAIPGSHDFSPTGRTMLDVLENAGLLVNVVKGEVKDKKLNLKFTEDKKGAKIVGMLGKKGNLEKKFYESLETKNLEKETGFKIFMFHTAITELKPKSLEKMESQPISLLPKGFDYYAGGHVHTVEEKSLDGYKNIVYPGPLFPNNYRELEELKNGTYFVYDNGKIQKKTVQVKNVEAFKFVVENKTPEAMTQDIMSQISKREFVDTIVMLRLKGLLKSGKALDIDFSTIFKTLYQKGAYFVMRNSIKLSSKDFEEVQVAEDSVQKIEDKLLSEYKSETFDKKIILSLMKALSSEKLEDEKVVDYEQRIKEEADKVLGF
ncbi:exonuclease SbcCD subunit D, partial [Candidatus Woesearchaeota archaeon]|nr:exonuclease SbcCD subunit D [Candidatus Woesearchaeota archaeon]